MKKTYKQIPFDIELAKKIQSGEVEGRIVTSENLLVRIVDFNLKDKTDSIVYIGTYANGEQEFIQTCNNEGKSFGAKVLYIELPEEAPKQAIHGNDTECDIFQVYKQIPEHGFKIGDKVKVWGSDKILEIVNIEGEIATLKDINYDTGVRYAYRIDTLYHVKPKHEFKPFDRVLVREDDFTSWQAAFFSHIEYFDDGEQFAITTSGDNYNLANNEIIPYEGNEHLVGTTDKPK